MNILFTTAEESLCQCVNCPRKATNHACQPHLQLSSLPSPAEPLSIASFPIDLGSKARSYDPKNIANLWLQLLSIHIQSGSFWKYEDVLKTHKDAVKAASRAAGNMKPIPLDVKAVLFIRHRLQKAFCVPEKVVSTEELKTVDNLISRLETATISTEIITSTKIHSVCKASLKQDVLQGDDDFAFRVRLEKLLARYRETIENPENVKASSLTLNDAQNKPLDKETALRIRHQLQRLFMSTGRTTEISAEELEQAASLTSKLESGSLSQKLIWETKLNKVWSAVLKQDAIPGDVVFQFRVRFDKLLRMYQDMLDSPEAAQTSATSAEEAEKRNNKGDKMDESPTICITQLTVEQCAQLKEKASACTTPLSPEAVELACLMPYFHRRDGNREQHIVPQAKICRWLQDFTSVDRNVYSSGPIIPNYMFQLTDYNAVNYGYTTHIDTLTGEALELRDWEPLLSTNQVNEVCTKFDGPRQPIEELLREWVGNFLSLKWIANGGEDIITDKCRTMEYLDHRDLLLEYGWPHSFPLPQSQYHTFLQRKATLWKDTLSSYQHDNSLHSLWSQLCRKWYLVTKFNYTRTPDRIQEIETVKVLDDRICKELRYHVMRNKDRAYALRADVPMQKRFLGPVTMGTSTSSGSDWHVDITPEMEMKRFEEVLAMRSESNDEIGKCIEVGEKEVEEMRNVIEGAFKRWTSSQQGIYEFEVVEGEDDDEMSDFELVDDEDDEGSESTEDEYIDGSEGTGSDEEGELEFEAVLLEADARIDVEPIRRALEGF